MNKEEEILSFIEHKAQIGQLSGENDKINRLISWENEGIEERFNKIISGVKDERDRIVRENDVKKQTEINKNKQEINKLSEYVVEMNKKLITVQSKNEIKRDLTIKNHTIHPYRDKEIWFHGSIFKDKYLNLIGFVVENDKPKNKYSIWIYGKCAFPKEIFEPQYAYGGDTHEDERFNVKFWIRDMPTLEEQQQWFKTKPTEIERCTIPGSCSRLLDFLRQYITIRDEYLEIIKRYSLDDFKPLFAPITIADILDAPVVFKVDKKEMRLYENFYYAEVKRIDKDEAKHPDVCTEYIQVDKKIYRKVCRKDLYCIKQTGNTMFGDWWSFDLGEYDSGYGCIPFTKSDYEKELAKTKEWINEKNKNRTPKIHVRWPKVEWVAPQLI